jgi:hypothetical protein
MEVNLQEIWTERIRAYQASGQTMKAWSEAHNVTLHQFKYWLYKAQKQERAAVTTSALVLNRICFARWSQPSHRYAELFLHFARVPGMRYHGHP